jgi:hypothetical protein
MKIDTAVIRQFLRKRFNDEELDALCFDYFADVQQDFTLGMTKGQKISLLLDHCRRQKRLRDLLAALERERPDLYKAHFGDEKIVSTLLSSELAGVRIKIFRWAPGFLGAQGSGGGEAFLTLPTAGDVAITIEVID